MNFVKLALENGGNIHPLIIPSSDLKGPALTNPSIYNDNGKILVNLRNINYTLYHSEKKRFEHPWGPLVYIHPENDWRLRTWNYMCEMDENMHIKKYNRVDTSSFPDKELWEFVGLEDARIVRWDDKLYITGVRRDLDTIGTGRMELSELEITENGVKEINQHRIPIPGDDDTLEYCNKNWMPILDLPYHYVKWTNGTEIVRYDIETNKTYRVCVSDWKDLGCVDLRGGSQVLPLGDYRFALLHETYLTKSPAGRKDGIYRHRFVVWDKDWNIVKVSKQFSFLNGEIEFAVGMCEYNNDYLITFGFQDNAAYLLKVSQELVLDFIGMNEIQVETNSEPEPQVSWGTDTLDGHLDYTNLEWSYKPFYATMINFLRDKKIQSFLDVGGCTGEVVKIFFSQIPTMKEAVILEPVPVNFDYIQNRFKDDWRVKIINKALHYGAETISLGQSDGNIGGYNMNSQNHTTQFNQLPTITLENLPKYDFIKIDIEGGERNVLENTTCLSEFKYIAIEFHDDMATTWTELIEKYIPTHKIAVDGRLYGNPESVLLEVK
jgi:FkbM family methyltransferase